MSDDDVGLLERTRNDLDAVRAGDAAALFCSSQRMSSDPLELSSGSLAE